MNENKQKRGRVAAIGFCILPIFISLFLQLALGLLFSVAATFYTSLHLVAKGITEQAVLEQAAYDFIMENSIWSVVVYHIIGLLVFGLWYYFSNQKQKPKNPFSYFTLRTGSGIVVTGIGMQFFVTAGVSAAGFLLPEVIRRFEEQIALAGVNDITLGSVLATVVLAPIGEELLCRGLVFRYAKRVSSNFIIANCIQALAFGIMHGNIVQGVYAFILGYLLGMIYERFHTLYASMLAHCIVNLSGMVLVPIVLASAPSTFMASVFIMLVSAAVIFAGGKMIGKSKPAAAETAV